MKYPPFLILCFTFGLVLLLSCDGLFPSAARIGVPADHTESRKGALHKGGKEEPFGEGGCSDSDCHQSDLRGGVVNFEGRITVTPSCFQCHGALWEGERERGK